MQGWEIRGLTPGPRRAPRAGKNLRLRARRLPYTAPVQILHQFEAAAADAPPVCLAIGVFDGVHRGHQAILQRMHAEAHVHGARAVVVTFDRHPNAVVAPERVPAMIYPLSQKCRTLAALGVETLLLLRFDRALSEQSGDAFVRALARGFGRIRCICVGENFRFGHRRSGGPELLRQLGAELGFAGHALPPVTWAGRPISSTRIREAIRQGDLHDAGDMLGRSYALAGRVVPGERLGRQLGFPTANLDTTGLVLPPHGVYVARAMIWPIPTPSGVGAEISAARSGPEYSAVVNIGCRPTVTGGEAAPRVEVHLLDFTGELLGCELEVQLGAKLRDEQAFPSLDALRAQIARDVAAAQAHR